MFKTSGRASFLIILFQCLQYYVFVVLSGDAFSPALLLRLLHQRRRSHTKTFFAPKERLAIFCLDCVCAKYDRRCMGGLIRVLQTQFSSYSSPLRGVPVWEGAGHSVCCTFFS